MAHLLVRWARRAGGLTHHCDSAAEIFAFGTARLNGQSGLVLGLPKFRYFSSSLRYFSSSRREGKAPRFYAVYESPWLSDRNRRNLGEIRSGGTSQAGSTFVPPKWNERFIAEERDKSKNTSASQNGW